MSGDVLSKVFLRYVRRPVMTALLADKCWCQFRIHCHKNHSKFPSHTCTALLTLQSSVDAAMLPSNDKCSTHFTGGMVWE